MPGDPFAAAAADGVRWSVFALPLAGVGAPDAVEPDLVLPSASAIAYSCLASWRPDESDPQRDRVLAAVREFGRRLRAAVA